MKIELNIDPNLSETRVVIHAPCMTEEIEALLRRLSAPPPDSITAHTQRGVELLPVESLNGTFCQCKCLHTVYPMDVSAVNSISYETFKGCSALKELRLYGLRSSLNLSMVPLLTYASLLYIVSNAGDTTGINRCCQISKSV